MGGGEWTLVVGVAAMALLTVAIGWLEGRHE